MKLTNHKPLEQLQPSEKLQNVENTRERELKFEPRK